MVGWFRRFRPSPPPLVLFCVRRPPLFFSLALSGFARFGPGLPVLVFAPSLFFCIPLFASWLSNFHLIFIFTSSSFPFNFISFSSHCPDLNFPTLPLEGVCVEHLNRCKTSRRTWHRPMIVQKLLFRCGANAISCGKRPSKKNCFTVVCNPYRVLCCKTRRTNKVAFSLHRMRDLTASPVAVSKSDPVCSHLHF